MMIIKKVEQLNEIRILDLKHFKYNFFDKDLEWFYVYFYVKQINSQNLEILFEENKILINFSTIDLKFLRQFDNASENTKFKWIGALEEIIIPISCSYKATNSSLELKLKKKNPKRWKTFNAILSFKEKNVASSTEEFENSTVYFSCVKQIIREQTESIESDRDMLSIKKKPTCVVSPLTKIDQIKSGYTGLDNIGNTCFMNSVLQCLCNTLELREYFLDSRYKKELNIENPLGMQGQLAMSFGALIKNLWCKGYKSCSPERLKMLVSSKAPQFYGFAQHDAQEFMTFLLDGLHEDLNRIKNPRSIRSVIINECLPEEQIADLSWEQHKQRNDSIIVDLFQGQFRSALLCPDCNKLSVTFDPFSYLSVPLPERQITVRPIMFWNDPKRKPITFQINVPLNALAGYILEQINWRYNIPCYRLVMWEINRSCFQRQFFPYTPVNCLQSDSQICIYELYTGLETAVDIPVLQRLLEPPHASHCNACNKVSIHLKRCAKCLRAAYCDEKCQKIHWKQHQYNCIRQVDLIGCPFYLSLPLHCVTYSYLCQLILSYSRFSVNVFRTPLRTIGDNNLDGLYRFSTDKIDNEYSLTNQNLLATTQQQSFNQSTEFPFSLYFVNQFGVNNSNEIIRKSEELIHFPPGCFLAIEWCNSQKKEGHVLIQSKEIDVERLNYNDSDPNSSRSEHIILDDCLRLFTQPEQLSLEEAWFCSRCTQHKQATKQLSIWRLPPILIIQLARFSSKNFFFQNKITIPVQYPLYHLDFKPYISSNKYINCGTFYDLYGVIKHKGGLLGGHYTCYVRCSDSHGSYANNAEWREFDDELVKNVSENEIITSDAYVLFYRQCNTN